MNHRELIDAVSERAVVTKAQAKTTVEATIAVIIDELVAGNDVRINGIGALKVQQREARLGRNPRTGEPMSVAAKRLVKLTIGQGLTDALNPENARPSVLRRA